MLMAYVSIVVAAVARLPGVLPLGPVVFFGLAFMVVLAGVIYDKAARGHVHPVYVWGGGLLVISIPLRLAISRTEAWKLFAGVGRGPDAVLSGLAAGVESGQRVKPRLERSRLVRLRLAPVVFPNEMCDSGILFGIPK